MKVEKMIDFEESGEQPNPGWAPICESCIHRDQLTHFPFPCQLALFSRGTLRAPILIRYKDDMEQCNEWLPKILLNQN